VQGLGRARLSGHGDRGSRSLGAEVGADGNAAGELSAGTTGLAPPVVLEIGARRSRDSHTRREVALVDNQVGVAVEPSRLDAGAGDRDRRTAGLDRGAAIVGIDVAVEVIGG